MLYGGDCRGMHCAELVAGVEVGCRVIAAAGGGHAVHVRRQLSWGPGGAGARKGPCLPRGGQCMEVVSVISGRARY